MKRLTQWLALASVAGLCLSAGNLMAQGAGGGQGGNRGGGQGGTRGGGQGGNFDPAQFQQRMMDSTRERLEITNDTEWQAIQPLVQKVMDLRREQLGGGGRGSFGGGRGRGGDQGNSTRDGGEANAEQTALSQAIDQNASKEVLQAKMAAYRKAKAAKETELKVAQDNLKKVLTVKQEALALQMGLVN